jgi:SAM-dependent methyltransferase
VVLDRQKIWQEYYQKVLAYPHKTQTEIATALNSSGNYLAIDCGCGTGADIAFLQGKEYEVFGFDIHEESTRICRERFADNAKVHISQSNFINYSYPESGLVLANASLFFCEPRDFAAVWSKINKAIAVGGVFCGDFMGGKDSWVANPEVTVCPFTEEQIKELFSDFEIVKFSERDSEGSTALGMVKHWHTYQIIAKKRVLSGC